MGNEKRRKREHSKEKHFLRQDWAETVSRLQQGSPEQKKEFPFTGNSFYIRCKMTDYLKNIGNRYLPSLSLIRSVCSFNIRSVAQWDIVVSTYLQMVQQLQTGTHINTYLRFLLINSRFLFKIEIKNQDLQQDKYRPYFPKPIVYFRFTGISIPFCLIVKSSFPSETFIPL